MIPYRDLPETEQREFISRLMHAIANNKTAYAAAQAIVGYCEDIGVFERVKFGTSELAEDYQKKHTDEY